MRRLIEHGHAAITVTRQAELLGLSRASVYAKPTPPSPADLVLQGALDRLYTAHPYYGQRRLRVMLRRDHGIDAGRDRIRSAMAVLGLETMYQQPRTSVSHPGHAVHPYLLRGVAADSPNHIWGTDITYIPIRNGYAYLVALLDWFSRYVVAWKLSENMEEVFCTENLRGALEQWTPRIHNSDQGSQFTSAAYVGALKEKKIAISMDGRGRCMDNIFTERLWRTVKYEDVYLKGYVTAREADVGIGNYFRFYNDERPHQSLGYRTPAEVFFGRASN